jgi:alpha-tubulin suppressor-like RCC1 family protein
MDLQGEPSGTRGCTGSRGTPCASGRAVRGFVLHEKKSASRWQRIGAALAVVLGLGCEGQSPVAVETGAGGVSGAVAGRTDCPAGSDSGGCGTSPGAALAVSAGGFHTCALTGAGAIKCWGWNYKGQLGNGSTTDSPVPVDVVGLSSGIVAVSAGRDESTCALTSAGALKCWGRNLYGQLGDGSVQPRYQPSVDVVGLSTGVVAVSAGAYHTCAVASAGAVKCWGNNDSGQLGSGSTSKSKIPVDVVGLSSGIIAVSAGAYHTCAVTSAGAVKCWGANHSGGLGNGSTTNSPVPVDVVGLSSGVVAVSAGWGYTCAVTSAGAAKCWGFNGDGRLGDGSTADSPIPVDVVGLSSGAAAISAGVSHTCVITSVGAVKCWGVNRAGELGNGSTTDSSTPADVVGLPSGILAISAGGAHTCALTNGGTIKCWGRNDEGELGNGSTTDSPTPVDVVGFATRAAPISNGS